MGRKPKVPLRYMPSGVALRRLRDAVRIDYQHGEGWRKEASSELQSLITLCLKADERMVKKDGMLPIPLRVKANLIGSPFKRVGQPVKMRISYTQDSLFLARLVAIVEKDLRQPKSWREEMSNRIRKVIVLFYRAERAANEAAV